MLHKKTLEALGWMRSIMGIMLKLTMTNLRLFVEGDCKKRIVPSIRNNTTILDNFQINTDRFNLSTDLHQRLVLIRFSIKNTGQLKPNINNGFLQ